jgi:creatinine deaminase
MVHKSDEYYMARAYGLALKSYSELGCPIGGVLADNDSGAILGEGHNALVQEGNPIIHGEMAAIRNAGPDANRHNATMYTTLQPCFMCAGAIVQFAIPRVVIGDATNSPNHDTIDFMRCSGIEVLVLEANTSKAASDCIDLAARFREENLQLWLKDWGGGPIRRTICSPRL